MIVGGGPEMYLSFSKKKKSFFLFGRDAANVPYLL